MTGDDNASFSEIKSGADVAISDSGNQLKLTNLTILLKSQQPTVFPRKISNVDKQIFQVAFIILISMLV